MADVVPALVAEVRAFRQAHPEIRYVDLICLDLPGHFYGKRYPIDALEKVAAGSLLKLPQNCILLGTQGGLYKIGDYCFNDGDPDAVRRLIPGTLKPVTWEKQPLGQMLITTDGTDAPVEFEPREVLARVLKRLARRGIRPVVAFGFEFYLFAAQLEEGCRSIRATACPMIATISRTCISSACRASPTCCTKWSTSRACGNRRDRDHRRFRAWPVRNQFRPLRRRAARGRLVGDVLPLHAWRRVAARLSRELHGQAVPACAGQRDARAREPLRRCGRNLLAADGQRPLRHAVAGCLALLPHCMPVFAPNHNAFRRYGSMVNAASRASWGFEDRDACIRIPESDTRNLRIEHRLASADANPYLVLAAILTGMEHGADAKLEPIAPLNEDRGSGIDSRRRCCRLSRRCRITRPCAKEPAASS